TGRRPVPTAAGSPARDARRLDAELDRGPGLMRGLTVAAALTLAVALAGCGEDGDPVQMALRDAAAARQAAAVKEGVTSPAATAPAADSGDAAFVARMIEHHEAALELARETL